MKSCMMVMTLICILIAVFVFLAPKGAGAVKLIQQDRPVKSVQPHKRVRVTVELPLSVEKSNSPLDFLFSVDKDGTIRDVLAHQLTDEGLRNILITFGKCKRDIHIHAVNNDIPISTFKLFLVRIDNLNVDLESDISIIIHTN